MFKKIPGNHSYRISLSGEVINDDGSGCAPPIVDNKMWIVLYGKKYLVDLGWLSLIAHYEVNLPNSMLNRIWDISFIECNIKSKNALTNKIMVFKRPMVVFEKYRIIPGFTNYAVSEEGGVIDAVTGQAVPRNNKPSSLYYPEIWLYNPDRGFFKSVKIHRLVALAWVKNPDWANFCIVNHRDGNKLNYNKENLEWTTYKGNAIHAFETGLRTDNIRCKVRNFETKEISIFPTIRQACLFMNINPDTKLKNILYKRKGRLINGLYEIKLDSDNTPWFYDEQETFVKQGRYEINVKFENGDIQTFNDLRDLKKKLKIWNTSNVDDILIKVKQKYPNIEIDLKDNFHYKPVEAINVYTKEVFEAESIRELSRKLNIHYSRVYNNINSGETRVSGEFAFRFKTNEPWNVDFEKFACSPMRILATNKVTKEEKVFRSLREVAKHFHVDRDVIKMRLKTGSPYGNWLFRESNSQFNN